MQSSSVKRKTSLSIIIPTYNQPRETIRLLDSIVLPKNIKSEIIVVDDGSKGGPLMHGIPRQARDDRKSITLLRHPYNRGVAAARNTGARAARGEVLCFLDGDVRVFPDTLTQIVRVFTLQPNVGAVSGIVVKDRTTRSFFPRYKSLRTWCYWTLENRGNPNTQTLGNACFAVRRKVFFRAGGFDERFEGASIEDNELGARIARIAPVVFEPRIRIRHTYESFRPMVRRYITRSILWTKLFWERRRFESAGMSRRETINGVLASLVWIFPPLLPVHLYLGRRFYGFVLREEGWSFMVKSLGVQLVLYPLIYLVAGGTSIRVLFAQRAR